MVLAPDHPSHYTPTETHGFGIPRFWKTIILFESTGTMDIK